MSIWYRSQNVQIELINEFENRSLILHHYHLRNGSYEGFIYGP